MSPLVISLLNTVQFSVDYTDLNHILHIEEISSSYSETYSQFPGMILFGLLQVCAKM